MVKKKIVEKKKVWEQKLKKKKNKSKREPTGYTYVTAYGQAQHLKNKLFCLNTARTHGMTTRSQF